MASNPRGGVPAAVEQARVEAGADLRDLLAQLARNYPERQPVLDQAVLALVAGEHQLVFGPPGTGKSELAAALLKRIVDGQGRPSLYARQIVETTVQTDLVGPVDFKTLTETGRTVHLLDEGILNAEFAVLDEVFDGRDLLLRSLLSVLNERELAVGPVVHQAALRTALLTTNRYLSEVLAARPETLQAFVDRIAFSCFVPKAFASAASRDALLRRAAGELAQPSVTLSRAGLGALREAAAAVPLPSDAREALSALAELFPRVLAEAAAERKGFSPSCYLSPRALVKAVRVLRASVVVDRYVRGRDRALRVEVSDLACLKAMFALGGPLGDDLSRIIQATTDPKEKWQLEIVRLENGAFDRAVAVVTTEHQRRTEAEAKALGLPDMKAWARRRDAASAPEVALRVAEALKSAKSEPIRAELEEIARSAALSFARSVSQGASTSIPLPGLPGRLRASELLANLLAEESATGALALAVARQGILEATSALAGVAAGEAGAEFDLGSAVLLPELVQRTAGLARQFKELAEPARALERFVPPAESGAVERVEKQARERTARAIRRRAMGQVALPSAGGWAELTETARQLEALDAVLELLAPGEGKARSHLLAGRAGALLSAALAKVREGRTADLASELKEGVEKLEALGIERQRALKPCRLAIQRRLETLRSVEGGPSLPEGPPGEEGYLGLIASCAAASERAAALSVIELAGLEGSRLASEVDAALARRDLAELSAQVSYLARWLDAVIAKAPRPEEIASLEEAEAVWASVAAARFFAVGWRDRDLVALRQRLTALARRPDLASEAARAGEALEAVASAAEAFGEALLQRKAHLTAAA